MFSLVAAGVLLYVNSWHGSFHFDDYVYIVEAKGIRDLSHLKAIWHALGNPTRFVGMLSFALDYHFHGFSVKGYHIVNTLLHAGTGLVVFLFVQELLRLDIFAQLSDGQRQRIAWLSAALFLVHPLNSEPVDYICQRFTILAAFFYILALYFFLLARRRSPKFFIGLFAAGLLGMFSKEIVFTLPVMILWTEGMLLTKGRGERIYAKGWFWGILSLLLVIPVVTKFSVVRYVFVHNFDSWSHIGDTMNAYYYFLTQPKVVLRYILLFFVPLGQRLIYDIPTGKSFLEPKTFFSFLAMAVLLGGGLKFRKKYPLYVFGLGWFFIALLVESTIIPLRQVIFEHRCYLPSVGIFLGAAYFWETRMVSCSKKWIVAFLILGVLSFLTFKRNQVWHDELSLWSDVIQKTPGLTSPYTHRGMTYMALGKDNLALEDFNRAIQNNPKDGELYNNRGNLYLKHRLLNRALADYDKALALDPTLAKTYSNRGVIYKMRKQYARALADYNRSLKLDPTSAVTYFNKANIYRRQERWEAALAQYSKAIQYQPKHAQAYFYRSQIYAYLGRKKEAREDARTAQSLGLVIPKAYLEQLK